MELSFQRYGSVGIFNFSGKLTREFEDNLKIALMRAIHSIDKAVLDFKKVDWIDFKCLRLIKEAYYTSVRLKNPLILVNLHQSYLKKISHQMSEDHAAYSPNAENEHNGIDKEEVYD